MGTDKAKFMAGRLGAYRRGATALCSPFHLHTHAHPNGQQDHDQCSELQLRTLGFLHCSPATDIGEGHPFRSCSIEPVRRNSRQSRCMFVCVRLDSVRDRSTVVHLFILRERRTARNQVNFMKFDKDNGRESSPKRHRPSPSFPSPPLFPYPFQRPTGPRSVF
jgi:hypothetical protein